MRIFIKSNNNSIMLLSILKCTSISRKLFEVISILAFIVFFQDISNAQNQTLLSPLNTTIRNLSLDYNTQGIIYWKCGSLNKGQLFTVYKSNTGLGAEDSMHLDAVWVDSMIGLTHYNYRHFYKGIPVEQSMYSEHTYEDTVYISMGRISEGLSLSEIPSLSEANAIEYALDYVNADEYLWENDTFEAIIKYDSLPNDTSWYPKGQLVYAFMDADSIGFHYKLAWKFNVSSSIPSRSVSIYVDASNGNIIDSIDLRHYDGTFNHVYLGNKNIDTKWVNTMFSDYHVTEANNNGHLIKSREKVEFGSIWKSKNLPSDDDDEWGNSQWSSTTSLWNFTQVWDYFDNIWKRKGTNGLGREIRIYSNYEDAQYDSRYKEYGYDLFKFRKNGSNNYQGALDISGHEYLHAIIDHGPKGNLLTVGEQGALGESFGDIFGTLAEMNIKNTGVDWVMMGELETQFHRKLDDPSANIPIFDGVGCGTLPTSYPSIYFGSNWYIGNCIGNGGEIHCNSAVQSLWFVFLAQGGSQLGINVNGIGLEKASQITWYSLTNFIGTGDNYPIAREKSIAAAIALFGQCSFEHIQTCKAWAAVGVGNICDPCPLNGSCDFRGLIPEPEEPVLGLSDELKGNLRVYPNPVLSELNVMIDGRVFSANFNSLSIEVIDVLGNKVQINDLKLPKHLNKLDVSLLNKGIYTLILKSNDLVIGVNKFLKL